MNTHIRGKCCVCEKPADAIFEKLYCAGCGLKRQVHGVRADTLDQPRDVGHPRKRPLHLRQRAMPPGHQRAAG